MSPIPYNSEKVKLNKDDQAVINNMIEVAISPLENDMKDMKGNIKDIVYNSVIKAFDSHEQKFCEEHRKDVANVKKKLKLHDWWLWAITITIFVIILIMSL